MRGRIYSGEVLGLTLGVTVSYACNSAAPFPLLFSDPHFPAFFLLLLPLFLPCLTLSLGNTHTHVHAEKSLTNNSWKQGNYCDH